MGSNIASSLAVGPEALLAILVMALAAALCRLSGFWFMGLIPITPRVESALSAIPLAVMVGLIVPALLKGSVPEWAALAATVAAVRLGANDFVAIVLGISTVALLRLAL
jgi:uncharacterized membrane protein